MQAHQRRRREQRAVEQRRFQRDAAAAEAARAKQPVIFATGKLAPKPVLDVAGGAPRPTPPTSKRVGGGFSRSTPRGKR